IALPQSFMNTVLPLGKMTLMKSVTRLTSKGQVLIPKLVREQLQWMSGTELAVEIMDDGAVRLAPLKTGNPVDILYGCLKDLLRNPLADLEAEHRAEIEADQRWQRRGR
ncbi:MAG TPA: AbrB/MazE/SpoVT family DNA-binding domain-containing protein, partial [Thermoanaerobaculia bacterium]